MSSSQPVARGAQTRIPIVRNRAQAAPTLDIFQKINIIVSYILGGIGTAAGTGVCFIPLPGIQLAGAALVFGGASLVTYAVCSSKREAENRKYERLNRRNEAAMTQLQHLAENRQSQINQQLQQNQQLREDIASLTEEVNRFARESERNAQTVEKLNQVAALLNGGLTTFLNMIQKNDETEADALSTFKMQIGECTKVISSLKGEAAHSVAIILNVFERFASKMSELMSIQEKLDDTEAKLSRTLGDLQQSERKFERTLRKSQEIGQQLDTDVGSLRESALRLKRERTELKRLKEIERTELQSLGNSFLSIPHPSELRNGA